MERIGDAVERLAARFPPRRLDPQIVMARGEELRRAASWTRRRSAIAAAAALVLAAGNFGIGYSAARAGAGLPYQPTVIEHAFNPDYADCQLGPQGATISADPREGAPGTEVSVRGPIQWHLEDGSAPPPRPEDQWQIWWNVDASGWPDAPWVSSVVPVANAYASGATDRVTAGDALLVGVYVPMGACEIDARFVIPPVEAGTYPVAVLAVDHESATIWGEGFTITVG
jgi:hypothetical protein